MTKIQAEFLASLIILAPIGAIVTPLILWNNSVASWESDQRSVIVARASELAGQGQLHLGEIIKNPNPECLNSSCFQGTILKLPTSDTCGVVFAGKQGTTPSGTTIPFPFEKGSCIDEFSVVFFRVKTAQRKNIERAHISFFTRAA